MESVAEGYTASDPAGSGNGPWATPSTAEAPPMHEAVHADGGPLSPTEEALVRALAEVDRIEAELRSLEPLRERLQTELQRASTDADTLLAQVTDAYAREQERLEAELRQVQKRAASFQEIRETRSDGRTKAKRLGVVKAMSRNGHGDPDPTAAPTDQVPELPTAPANGAEPTAVPTEASTSDASSVATIHPDPLAPSSSVATTDPDPLAPATAHEPAKGADGEPSAYEDHWYQVLRRDNLGSTS